MSNLQKTKDINISAIELVSVNVEKSKSDERGKCWEYNISEQFPVKSVNKSDGAVECIVGKPHEGYVIKTTLRNSKMNGPSKIYSTKKVIVATITFVDNVATGPCKLYDEYGNLYYEGHLENGYRQGKGKLYDERGLFVYEVFYDKGNKKPIIELREMNGYWKEQTDEKELIRIAHRDNLGNLDGICYAYNKGMLSKITTWKEGKERLYSGHLKIYDEPRKVWLEGDVENGFFNGKVNALNSLGVFQFQEFYEQGKKKEVTMVKQGNGYWKELDVNGNTVSLTRKNMKGENEGICYFYSDGKISRISEWKNGREITLYKRMTGNTMTMYRNGKKVYEGGFLDSFEKGFPQNGEGEEYDKDGETLVFRGHYENGLRHGEGAVYKDGAIVNREKWIKGQSQSTVECNQCGNIFAFVMCIIVIFLFIVVVIPAMSY